MTEDTPIDLLVLHRGGSVSKCQCKYMFPTANGSHMLPLCAIRKNGAGSKAVKHVYTAEEVDYFLGYCHDNDTVYVIPFAECRGRSSLKLWVSRQRAGTNGEPAYPIERWVSNFAALM